MELQSALQFPGNNALSATDTLAATIARFRRRSGKSQAALAADLGISTADLAGIEAGTRQLHLDDIDSLSAALGIAPHELFSG